MIQRMAAYFRFTPELCMHPVRAIQLQLPIKMLSLCIGLVDAYAAFEEFWGPRPSGVFQDSTKIGISRGWGVP